MRIVATFESTLFKIPSIDSKDLDGPPGHDVALWLASRIGALGYETGKPQPEDFGWYLPFSSADHEYHAVIGPDEEFWYVVVERSLGFVQSLMGMRRRHKNTDGLLIVHRALHESGETDNLQWHTWKSFSRGGAGAFKQGVSAPAL